MCQQKTPSFAIETQDYEQVYDSIKSGTTCLVLTEDGHAEIHQVQADGSTVPLAGFTPILTNLEVARAVERL